MMCQSHHTSAPNGRTDIRTHKNCHMTKHVKCRGSTQTRCLVHPHDLVRFLASGGPSVLLCYVSSHIRCHNTRDSGSRPAGAVSGKPAWLYPGCFLPGPSKASSSGGPRALRKGAAGASQSIAPATGSLPLPSTKQPVGPGQEGISRELPRQPIPGRPGLAPNRAHATW